MKIALVSLDIVWEDKSANIELCRDYISRAAQQGAEMVIFPEMTLTGFSMNAAGIAENSENSETIRQFAEIAGEYQIAVLHGVAVKSGSDFQNWLVMTGADGKVITSYAKVHPFSFAGEDQYYTGGDRIVVGEFKGVKFGLSICYDLRFPELYTALARRCDMLVNIANWPARRADHWSSLLKARAIENQTFMIGVNRTGMDGNGLEYVPGTAIFNANGESLESCSSENNMDIYEVDAHWTLEFRKTLDTVSDRKTEFYKSII